MGNTRTLIAVLVVGALILAALGLNALSGRPKQTPDIQLEGRLAGGITPKPIAGGGESGTAAETPAGDDAGDAASTGEDITLEDTGDMSGEEQGILDKAKGSVVKLETEKGDIYLVLCDDKTPIHVGNFLELVGSGFYDGLTFHRVIPDFMVQAGCPRGDGTGGPGFTIPDEANKGPKHLRGSLSMAKTAAPNSGGSQFFICRSPQAHLDGLHTVFGECVKGMDVVDAIRKGDKINKAVILKKSDKADDAIKTAKQARVPE